MTRWLPALVLIPLSWFLANQFLFVRPGLEQPRAGAAEKADEAPKAAAPTDWPMFRGNPLQTGVSGDKMPDKLEVLWTMEVKQGIESTAAIVDGVVYIGAFDGHLYALDLKDGKERWKYKAEAIKAAPSVKDGLVFVGDEEGKFHCVDAKTGKGKWTFETNGEISGGANFAGDKVLFASHDSTLYLLNIKDGSLVWKYRTQGPVYGAPVVAEGMTFLAGCDSELHLIDLRTGKSDIKIGLDGQSGSTVAVDAGKVYVGTMADEVLSVDLKKKDVFWRWKPVREQAFYSSAAVTDKLTIIGCRDKHVYGLDRVKGDTVWAFKTKGKVDSSPVVAGNRVYVGSGDGHLYVLDRDKGTLVQSIHLGESILASPALAGGRLIIGTVDGKLACLGAK